MSAGEFVGLVIFMLVGYVPAWFAMRTRRRWLRILLALVASFYLLMSAALILLAGSADQIQGTTVATLVLALAIACGLSALAAFALAFIPVKAPSD